MGEFELIRQYFAAAPCAQPDETLLVGIGDDCALLKLASEATLATSTDTLVAGVHFPDPCDPFLLGQRALAVAVSDLAAMGATPLAFTLALTLPTADAHWLHGLATGLNQMAQRCAIRLAGGDTTRGPLSLTLTVLGQVPASHALTRAGAQVGDWLCVGGPLGAAAGALPLVLGTQKMGPTLADPLLAAYWSPQPQLDLGLALRGKATAALDISDGLLADCAHIATASKVALIVEPDRVPLPTELVRFLGIESARQHALAGGDDYVLAFTLPPQWLEPLQAQGWPIHVIGQVEAGQGVWLQEASGQRHAPLQTGYCHF